VRFTSASQKYCTAIPKQVSKEVGGKRGIEKLLRRKFRKDLDRLERNK